MDFNGLTKTDYNTPTRCEKCGASPLEYMGIGEYKCEKCGFLMYDDYGKVRNYIEENPGATAIETSAATGVSKEKIRRLLREDKIQVAPGSVSFLRCDACGKEIRSGRFCLECEKNRRIKDVASAVKNRVSNISGGFSKTDKSSSGAKRFNR